MSEIKSIALSLKMYKLVGDAGHKHFKYSIMHEINK